MVPKTLIAVDALPLLGSGKVDHAAARALAEELLAAGKAA